MSQPRRRFQNLVDRRFVQALSAPVPHNSLLWQAGLNICKVSAGRSRVNQRAPLVDIASELRIRVMDSEPSRVRSWIASRKPSYRRLFLRGPGDCCG
jgi:hypothetical protein